MLEVAPGVELRVARQAVLRRVEHATRPMRRRRRDDRRAAGADDRRRPGTERPPTTTVRESPGPTTGRRPRPNV